LLLVGCASAGGTAGISDIGSVWYKQPTTGDVKECGGGFYPGVQIRRYVCGKRLQGQGYDEVEKCKDVAVAGTPCVTEADMHPGMPRAAGGSWVLWTPILDVEGRPVTDRWLPTKAFDSRPACEAEQRRASGNASLLCLPDTVDPRGVKGGGR
jgi:hypothetical protein